MCQLKRKHKEDPSGNKRALPSAHRPSERDRDTRKSALGALFLVSLRQPSRSTHCSRAPTSAEADVLMMRSW
jgi:hypothetical protein